MATTLADLVVNIRADATDLDTTLKVSERSLQSAARRMSTVVGAIFLNGEPFWRKYWTDRQKELDENVKNWEATQAKVLAATQAHYISMAKLHADYLKAIGQEEGSRQFDTLATIKAEENAIRESFAIRIKAAQEQADKLKNWGGVLDTKEDKEAAKKKRAELLSSIDQMKEQEAAAIKEVSKVRYAELTKANADAAKKKLEEDQKIADAWGQLEADKLANQIDAIVEAGEFQIATLDKIRAIEEQYNAERQAEAERLADINLTAAQKSMDYINNRDKKTYDDNLQDQATATERLKSAIEGLLSPADRVRSKYADMRKELEAAGLDASMIGGLQDIELKQQNRQKLGGTSGFAGIFDAIQTSLIKSQPLEEQKKANDWLSKINTNLDSIKGDIKSSAAVAG